MKTKKSASIHLYFRHFTLLLVFSMAITSLLCACNPTQEGSNQENVDQESVREENVNQKSETLTGFISIQDGTVILDEVEIITEEDTDRIDELGLTYQGDLISGYYIYNEDEETVTYELSDKTIYHFVDIGQLYTSGEDLNYETTSLEEFMAGSSYSSNSTPNEIGLPTGRIPYSVEVVDERVISITEEFIYTF